MITKNTFKYKKKTVMTPTYQYGPHKNSPQTLYKLYFYNQHDFVDVYVITVYMYTYIHLCTEIFT